MRWKAREKWLKFEKMAKKMRNVGEIIAVLRLRLCYVAVLAVSWQ